MTGKLALVAEVSPVLVATKSSELWELLYTQFANAATPEEAFDGFVVQLKP